MYSFFRGKVFEIKENSAIIDVQDIGYEINMPDDDLIKLKEAEGTDEKIVVYTYFSHFEAGMVLYGFLEKNRLEFFKKLITVNGVGAKAAITIISNIAVEEMCTAVLNRDENALKKVPGIGPKTASKIVFELKDKIDKEALISSKTSKNNTKVSKNSNDAIAALKVLGFAENEIAEVLEELGQEVEEKTTEEIIKKCLKNLRK